MPKKKVLYRCVSAADNPLRVPGAGLLPLQPGQEEQIRFTQQEQVLIQMLSTRSET